jgi:hypothetical protein
MTMSFGYVVDGRRCFRFATRHARAALGWWRGWSPRLVITRRNSFPLRPLLLGTHHITRMYQAGVGAHLEERVRGSARGRHNVSPALQECTKPRRSLLSVSKDATLTPLTFWPSSALTLRRHRFSN